AGGRIRLGQGFQPPRWLALSGPFDLGGTLVQFYLGDQEGVLDRAPFGANMAFRRTMFEKYGSFRPDLDRCSKSGSRSNIFARIGLLSAVPWLARQDNDSLFGKSPDTISEALDASCDGCL